MDCHKFDEELQNLLNDESRELSSLADDHRRKCERCDLAYRELLSLRRLAREIATPRLDRRSENHLVKQIVGQAAPLRNQEPMFPLLSDLFAGLRWDRLLLAGGLATALLAVVLRLTEPKVQGPDPLQADAEIQEMVEEHVMAMDSGIFQGTSEYAKFIKETDEK
jgi:anti-sigma factor RsiW